MKVGEAINDIEILEELPDIRTMSYADKANLIEVLKTFNKGYGLHRSGWSAWEDDEQR